MHRSHIELTLNSLKSVGENTKLMIQPVVGVTQDCDINYHTRIRCYRKILKYYPENTTILSLLPLSMRMAGPREALWHALIRQNYGCTHFIVGRDHAGPSSKTKEGNPFYDSFGAHKLLKEHENELTIKVVTSQFVVYVEELKEYFTMDKIPEGHKPSHISGTQLRNALVNDTEIPAWYSDPEVITELKKDTPPMNKRGLCLYFTGLSGAGKSTIANALYSRLLELENSRNITVLDGDTVRLNLSKELGFSKKDRSTNVRRIGYVASEIVKHRGICLCANIAPYKDDRDYNRKLINSYGKYIEVFVNTPLQTCENRDVKGLYQLARQNIIKEFTGISDPYEEPENAEILLEGDGGIDKSVDFILNYLSNNNLL